MRAKRYEDRSDPLQKFLNENVEESLSDYITKADFLKKLGPWLREHKFREMSETSIGMKLKKLGFEQTKMSFGWMNDGKGGQARVWLGIKWKN